MADKAALEMIGVLLFIATLFVIGAGGLAVRHQLAGEQYRLETAELTQLSDHLQTMNAGTTPAAAQSIK
jgi:hypothetical protein